MSSTPDEEKTLPYSRWKPLCYRLWRLLRFFWIGIIWTALVGSIPNIFFLGTGTRFKDLLVVSWWNTLIVPHFLIVILVFLGVIILTLIAWLVSREEKHRVSIPASHERSAILLMLRKAYTEAQNSSLQSALKRIDLQFSERFDLTVPLQLHALQLEETQRPLPSGASILNIFDQAGRGLLLVGEPGAGKSTLLYELAQMLLSRAEYDEKQPLPIVVNLSSWGLKKQTFEEWVALALEQRYHLSRRFWQRWLQEERLLLLLDGLDEVERTARSSCISALNSYHREHVTPHVVCSRLQDYQALSPRLTLQSAVAIEPLTLDHIRTYLKQAGRQLAAVRKIVETNRVLQELLTTPLMLMMVILTYQGKSAKDIHLLGTIDQQRDLIFENYYHRMLASPMKLSNSSPKMIQHSLHWLAEQMHQHSQSILYLEQLQPDWLGTKRSQALYEKVGRQVPNIIIGILLTVIVYVFYVGETSITNILLYGLVGGVLAGVLSKKLSLTQAAGEQAQDRQALSHGLGAAVLGLNVAVSALLILHLSYPLLNDWVSMYEEIQQSLALGLGSFLLALLCRAQWFSSKNSMPSGGAAGTRFPFWKALIPKGILMYGLLAGGVFGISALLSYSLDYQGNKDLATGSIMGLSVCLSIGLSATLIAFLLIRQSPRIEATEILVWSWKSLWQNLINGKRRKNVLFLAISIMITVGLSNGWRIILTDLGRSSPPITQRVYQAILDNGLMSGLAYGLGYGLTLAGCYWLLTSLFLAISSDRFQKKQRILPNLGIQRSLQNGLLLGIVSGGILALAGLLIDQLSNLLILNYDYTYLYIQKSEEPSLWLVVGIAGTCLFTLLMGGLPWWQHWALRFLLWREGAIPWRYVPMLDEAAQRIILRKEGGGYRFIHDLFRDYIASR